MYNRQLGHIYSAQFTVDAATSASNWSDFLTLRAIAAPLLCYLLKHNGCLESIQISNYILMDLQSSDLTHSHPPPSLFR